MCMYVCYTCACVSVCIHVHMHACVSICLRVYVDVSIYVCHCEYVYAFRCVDVRMFVCPRVYRRILVYEYT